MSKPGEKYKALKSLLIGLGWISDDGIPYGKFTDKIDRGAKKPLQKIDPKRKR